MARLAEGLGVSALSVACRCCKRGRPASLGSGLRFLGDAVRRVSVATRTIFVVVAGSIFHIVK